MSSSARCTPLQLYGQGLRDLVCIIPPNAQLSEHSRISPDSLGKIPGRRRLDGSWTGYPWQAHSPTAEELKTWHNDGANIGLRTAFFPAIDIDCVDESLATLVEGQVRAFLGAAPVRVGRPPKRLMLYTTSTPFPKLTLNIWREGQRHAVEILGEGQQCVIDGIHPTTMQPYSWDRPLQDITPASLTAIDSGAADSLLAMLAEKLTTLGYTCALSHARARAPHVSQSQLKAPSIQALREVMAAIPNDEKYVDRAAYIAMGHAIKAASGEDTTSGLEIFLDWANRAKGPWEDGNDPAVVTRDWAGFSPPYAIGWDWIVDRARMSGFNSARYEFNPVVTPAPTLATDIKAPADSDQDLADRFAARHSGALKHIPLSGSWRHWDGARWAKDELLIARDLMKAFLRGAADKVLTRIPTSKEETQKLFRIAKAMCSSGTAKHILELASSDKRIATTPDRFDLDPWLVNTPTGIVDLRTGAVRDHDPAARMTKLTGVGPDSAVACPRWEEFLFETAGGDEDLVAYLQRLCGYCLTGSTREQAIVFVYGSGGNGKSVFLNTLLHILGDYGKQAAMSVFLSTGRSEHPTELAALQGARLVAANETNSRGVWNEARLKSLSGGDRISARFLYGDHFEFTPVLKLLLVGNTKPSFPGVDDAMRRRLHLVSFTLKPAKPDRELFEKLKQEAPGILAWMIEGCLAWQKEGLNPPVSVLQATKEYLDDQDSIGRWLADACVLGPNLYAMNDALYESHSTWCNLSGEQMVSWNELRARLVERGFTPFQNAREANRRGLKGLALRPSEEFLNPAHDASPAPEEAA